MDGNTVTALFWLQEWQLVTLAILLALAFLYARGSRRVADVSRRKQASFYAATFVAVIVLASPLHRLGTILFSARVAQHLFLMAWIPALFTFSDPVPVLLAGLPSGFKKWIDAVSGGVWGQKTAVILKEITAPGSAFILATVSFWIWYDPTIHQLTIDYQWIHTFETAWLLLVALLYWWHIMAVYPRIHRPIPPIVRILYTIVGTWPIKLVGLILMVSGQALYNYPQSFQVGNLNINDQGVGAIIVWSLGGFVFSTTAALLMRDWLKAEEDKPIDPAPAWQTDQGMRAPGFPQA